MGDREYIKALLKRDSPTLGKERANEILNSSLRELRSNYYTQTERQGFKIFHNYRTALGMGLGFALGIMALSLAQRVNPPSQQSGFPSKLISQIESYGQQPVTSFIYNNGTVQSVELREEESTPGGKKRFAALQFGGEQKGITIFAESGAKVELNFSGEKIQLEVLEGSKGEILIASPDGAWSSNGVHAGELSHKQITGKWVEL